jgi:hypothetical protein
MYRTSSSSSSSGSSKSNQIYEHYEKPVPTQRGSDVVHDDDLDEAILNMDREDNLSRAHKSATTADGWPQPDPSAFASDDMEDDSDEGPEHALNRLEDLAELLRQFLPGSENEIVALQNDLAEYRAMIDQCKLDNQDYFPSEFWANFRSGATAFLLCFGPGTLTASALKEPGFGLLISTVLWALTERFSPMVRNTTWKNPHAEGTYPLIGNLLEQAARDAVRKSAGMKPLYAENEDKNVLLSAISWSDFWEAWKGKMITEDLPYYFYTLCYGVRSSIIAGIDISLSPTSPLSLITLLAAGTLAGAFTAVTMQYGRRRCYQSNSEGVPFAGQTVTRTMAMWEKEANLYEQIGKILKSTKAHLKDTNNLKGLILINKREEFFKEAHTTAHRKSRLHSSLLYEFTAMFGRERRSMDRRGEVAGKLSEFVAGLFAKGSVLSLSTLWNYQITMKYMATTTSVFGKAMLMWGQSTALIVAFNLRKEFELAYRGMLGLGLGAVDVAQYAFGGQTATAVDDQDQQMRLGRLRSIDSTQDLMIGLRGQIGTVQKNASDDDNSGGRNEVDDGSSGDKENERKSGIPVEVEPTSQELHHDKRSKQSRKRKNTKVTASSASKKSNGSLRKSAQTSGAQSETVTATKNQVNNLAINNNDSVSSASD